MTIDTEIRHVTKPGANLFQELGFSAEEAKRLQTASHKQINDTRQLKEQLISARQTSPLRAGSRARTPEVSFTVVSAAFAAALCIGE